CARPPAMPACAPRFGSAPLRRSWSCAWTSRVRPKPGPPSGARFATGAGTASTRRWSPRAGRRRAAPSAAWSRPASSIPSPAERRLTPWSNDPLADPHGETLLVRDEGAGAAWSPLPGPLPHPAAYTARHGLGASEFRLEAESLEHETTIAVDAEAPVKLVRLR